MIFLWKNYHKTILLLLIFTVGVGGLLYCFNTQVDKLPLASKLVSEKEKVSQEIIEKSESLGAKLLSKIPTNRFAREHANFSCTESTNIASLPNSDIDVEKIQQTARALVSGTEDEQIEAISLLSKIGTPEQKKIIAEYSTDTKKEIAVRLAAGENMDWEQNPEIVAMLLAANNPVAEAMIYMASTKKMSEEAHAIIDKAVYSAFFQSTKPSTQIAILNYFADQHMSQFDVIVDDLSSRITFEEYTPQDREEVTGILEQKRSP